MIDSLIMAIMYQCQNPKEIKELIQVRIQLSNLRNIINHHQYLQCQQDSCYTIYCT